MNGLSFDNKYIYNIRNTSQKIQIYLELFS